jgi:hypothetical protein
MPGLFYEPLERQTDPTRHRSLHVRRRDGRFLNQEIGEEGAPGCETSKALNGKEPRPSWEVTTGVWTEQGAVASLRIVDAHGVPPWAKDSGRVAYPTVSRGRNVRVSGEPTDRRRGRRLCGLHCRSGRALAALPVRSVVTYNNYKATNPMLPTLSSLACLVPVGRVNATTVGM